MIDEPILNAAITMAISVAVLALLLFLVKKYTPKLRGIKSDTDFKINSRLPLSAKTNLFIISVEGKRFLVGSGESSVNLITELDPLDAEKEIDLPPEKDTSFASILKQSFSKKDKFT